MDYISSKTIRVLREKMGLTQKQLAERLSVSDKTVSKWETGRGLPDITILEPLAAQLRVSVAELLSGEPAVNTNRSANMLRSKLYVCPICSNVIFSCGEGAFSCCGVNLPPLEAEQQDDDHAIKTENIDGELFVSVAHPMEKDHHISFIACVTDGNIQLEKLYPEQNAEARFRRCGGATIYAYCNKHGLFKIKI